MSSIRLVDGASCKVASACSAIHRTFRNQRYQYAKALTPPRTHGRSATSRPPYKIMKALSPAEGAKLRAIRPKQQQVAEFCWSAHFAPFLSMNRALSVDWLVTRKGKRGKCKKGKKVGGPVSRVSLQCNCIHPDIILIHHKITRSNPDFSQKGYG